MQMTTFTTQELHQMKILEHTTLMSSHGGVILEAVVLQELHLLGLFALVTTQALMRSKIQQQDPDLYVL